jgi:uroporphyrinogen decarboxylase
VWYHSDGNIAEIIPELIEIGVDVLNPVQPECVDVLEVKRRYGDRLVLDGTIGTQTVMPFGTPEDVRACVRGRVETLAGDGALILAPTHTLEPEVPTENVLAFAEACREYGRLS